MAANAARILSETILREETMVVNIAAAISTPHTGFSPNLLATPSTGMDEARPSASTTVCSINSMQNRQAHIMPQDANISL